MTAPFLVRPRYSERPWGGRRLETELGRVDLPEGPIGESWEVTDIDGAQSVVEGGPHDGRPLRDVWGAPFPLLLKVLDAAAPLSVQLHPDGADGGEVKEEAWVALAAGGDVAVGEAPAGTPPAEILSHLTTLPLSEGSEDGRTPPTVVHIPPGTVHAILPGALLFEVQNPADVTWRLYDHGRVGLDGKPRALHNEEAAGLLARGAQPAATLDPATGRLEGVRFTLTVLPPGRHPAVEAVAAFFGRPGRAENAAGGIDVPAGRTVVLPETRADLESAGWIVACAPGAPVA